tara:strand:+ start:647 stop:946 length:300 start_codon:yes stop_codon:yes gene_type:complete
MDETSLKLLNLFSQKKDSLIQLYINERQSKNELGALFNFVENNEMKSVFYTINDPAISEETKNDIIQKNNYRNSYAFFYLTDVKTSTTILKVEDLDVSI